MITALLLALSLGAPDDCTFNCVRSAGYDGRSATTTITLSLTLGSALALNYEQPAPGVMVATITVTGVPEEDGAGTTKRYFDAEGGKVVLAAGHIEVTNELDEAFALAIIEAWHLAHFVGPPLPPEAYLR